MRFKKAYLLIVFVFTRLQLGKTQTLTSQHTTDSTSTNTVMIANVSAASALLTAVASILATDTTVIPIAGDSTATSTAAVTVSPVSIITTQSSATSISYFMKTNAVFPISDSYFIRYEEGNCTCWRLCMEDPRCQHYSMISYPGFCWCRLTDLRFSDITQLTRANGKIAFNMRSNLFLGADNLYYFFVNQLLTFNDCVDECNSRGNFRVGIYKSKVQFDILESTYQSYGKEIWVDLNSVQNDPNPYAVWADGTPYNVTEIYKLGLATYGCNEAGPNKVVKFRFQAPTKHFEDRALSAGMKFGVLCQERELA